MPVYLRWWRAIFILNGVQAMVGLIYARVSTPGQREEGTSLDTQVEGCSRLAQDREIDVPLEFILV